jgi:hypothetical protein
MKENTSKYRIDHAPIDSPAALVTTFLQSLKSRPSMVVKSHTRHDASRYCTYLDVTVEYDEQQTFSPEAHRIELGEGRWATVQRVYPV